MSDTKFVPPSNQNFLALPVDTVIGRYRVTGILGQGSFGITYRAHDAQLGRDVAIKEYLPTSFAFRQDRLTVLPNSTGAAENFAWGRQRFVEEGRTLAGFQRVPGIVRVHDFLEANGTAYIVMELATGETLGARLQRQGRLTAAEVERILRALLVGLEKVHAASFIHRDIKPDNILLDDEGEPTLIDFGAARAAVAGRTSALTGIFTPGYAAVEQFTDARQGPFTDIYALSATLYQAITGEKPPSAIDRVLDDKYVPLAKRQPPGFAPALLTGIDRGMAVRPDARPQTVAAWRAFLFPGETREKPIPVQAPEPPTKAEKAPRRRLAAIAGLAVVLVAAAAGGALFLYSPQKAPVTDPDPQQAGRSSGTAAAAAAEKQRADEEAQRQAAAAAEKRRVEEEAQRKAAAAAAEKQRADDEARRQAAAAASEKRRVEEEAQRPAATAATAPGNQRSDAEAQRQASAAAAAAEKQKADEEAQRQAAAAAAAAEKSRADEEAQRQAAAEEAQRKADQEAQAAAALEQAQRLAEQQAQEQAAREQAERERAIAQDNAHNAEAEAEKAKAGAALVYKTTEATEAALHLAPVDRQRIQVALTAQGFDTHGNDGVLGPRSREMLAAWQTAHNVPATGFLDASQRQKLLGDSVAAVARFDAEQKKAAEEEAKRREQAARQDATTAMAGPSRRVPDPAPSMFAGRWSIVRSKCIPTTPQRFFGVTVEGNRFTYGFTFANRTASCSVAIAPDGSFGTSACDAPMSGRISGNRMTLSQRHPEAFCDFEFVKQ